MRNAANQSILLLLVFIFTISISIADVPNIVNYQGMLTDDYGVPLDTTVSMSFTVYDSLSGGSAVWSETHSSVAVSAGVFSVMLGSNTSGGVPASVFSDSGRFLGITVGGGSEYSPRVTFSSVAYSYEAGHADTADYALSAPGSGGGGWVDDGSVVRLETSGDWVGIGTSTPAAPLHVRTGSDINENGGGYLVIANNLDRCIRFDDNEIQAYSDSTATGATLYLQHEGTGNLDFCGGSMYIDSAGLVGIGTTNPQSRLHIIDDTPSVIIDATDEVDAKILFRDYNDPNNQAFEISFNASDQDLHIRSDDDTTDIMTLRNGGNVGIGINPATTLDINGLARVMDNNWPSVGGGMELAYNRDLNNGYIQVFDRDSSNWGNLFLGRGCVGVNTLNPQGRLHVYVPAGDSVGNGIAIYTSGNWRDFGWPESETLQFGTWEDTSTTYTPIVSMNIDGLHVHSTTYTEILTITGGSDLAEPFVMTNNIEIPKGALVVIDDQNPGKLKISDQPYDTRVAGIISGAGGVNPGLTLTQKGVFDGGQNVAIGGRVYCLADASLGAINPGDLLTTSAIPGHAMKASDRDRAYGAVIGKAMTALDEGRGLVLVLVNLQ